MVLKTVLKTAWFPLLCLLSHHCSARVVSFEKTVHQPAKELIFDGRTTRDPRLFYALCDLSRDVKKCKVVRDKELHGQGNDECEVTLTSSDNTGQIKQVRILPFGESRAMLLWYEQTDSSSILGLTSVKFGECSIHEIRTPFHDNVNDDYLMEMLDAATYEDSYDLIFKYPKVCGNKYCRLSVDVEKNKTEGPVTWLSADYHGIVDMNSVDPGSREKGILLSQVMPNSFFRISLVKDNDYKVLRHYENAELVPPLSTEMSINNNLIGVCVLTNETLRCSQYNYEGSVTFEFEQMYEDVALVAMYNLPRGFLILVNDIVNTQRFWIMKLDSQGKVLSSLNVKGIQCDQSMNFLMGIFYEKDGKYCFSTTCFENYEQSVNKTDRGHLDKTTQCFTLDDFVGPP